MVRTRLGAPLPILGIDQKLKFTSGVGGELIYPHSGTLRRPLLPLRDATAGGFQMLGQCSVIRRFLGDEFRHLPHPPLFVDEVIADTNKVEAGP